MNFFDVFIIFFENYLLALLSYVLMTRKESKTIFSILILGLVLSIETLISNYYYDYHLNIEISGTILLFSLYYSKDSFLYKIIISFIPFIILTMCNILAVAFFSILFQCEPRIIISENLYELISVILFMIITSMIFKMKVKGLFRDYKFFDNTWLPISLITFGMSVLFFILFEAISSGILNKRIVLIIFTLIIILISLCILLKVVIEEYKDKERVLLQLEKLKNDKEKYTSDLDFYQQLKILKHDMKYLYNYMNELIQHNEYKKLQEIIEKDINILYEEDDLK